MRLTAEPTALMDIAWFGASCFRIKHGGATILIDPYRLGQRYRNLKMAAHAISLSGSPFVNNGELRTIEGLGEDSKAGPDPYRIDRPGEYEIGNIFIDAWPAAPIAPDAEPGTLILRFRVGGASIVHMGQLAQLPTVAMTSEIRHCGALLVPPGGRGEFVIEQAARLAARVSPGWVVPMGYADQDEDENGQAIAKFNAALGLPEQPQRSDLTVTGSFDGQSPPNLACLRPRIALKPSAVA